MLFYFILFYLFI